MQCTYLLNVCYRTFSQNYTRFQVFHCDTIWNYVSCRTWPCVAEQVISEVTKGLVAFISRHLSPKRRETPYPATQHPTRQESSSARELSEDGTFYHKLATCFSSSFCPFWYDCILLHNWAALDIMDYWLCYGLCSLRILRFPSETRKCFTSPKCSDRFWCPPSCTLSVCNWGKAVGVDPSSTPSIPSLRMSRAKHPLSPHAFTSRTGTNLPLPHELRHMTKLVTGISRKN